MIYWQFPMGEYVRSKWSTVGTVTLYHACLCQGVAFSWLKLVFQLIMCFSVLFWCLFDVEDCLFCTLFLSPAGCGPVLPASGAFVLGGFGSVRCFLLYLIAAPCILYNNLWWDCFDDSCFCSRLVNYDCLWEVFYTWDRVWLLHLSGSSLDDICFMSWLCCWLHRFIWYRCYPTLRLWEICVRVGGVFNSIALVCTAAPMVKDGRIAAVAGVARQLLAAACLCRLWYYRVGVCVIAVDWRCGGCADCHVVTFRLSRLEIVLLLLIAVFVVWVFLDYWSDQC